jgi:hypothetical protein
MTIQPFAKKSIAHLRTPPAALKVARSLARETQPRRREGAEEDAEKIS